MTDSRLLGSNLLVGPINVCYHERQVIVEVEYIVLIPASKIDTELIIIVTERSSTLAEFLNPAEVDMKETASYIRAIETKREELDLV